MDAETIEEWAKREDDQLRLKAKMTRAALGWSQGEMAAFLHMSRVSYWQWETQGSASFKAHHARMIERMSQIALKKAGFNNAEGAVPSDVSSDEEVHLRKHKRGKPCQKTTRQIKRTDTL